MKRNYRIGIIGKDYLNDSKVVKALRALEEIEKTYGKNRAARVASAFLSALMTEAMEKTDWKRSSAAPSVDWLLTGRNPSGLTDGIVAIDHTTNYFNRTNRKRRLVVTEPYHLTRKHLERICQLPPEIEVTITGRSRWFPGWTVCVEFQYPSDPSSPSYGAWPSIGG